MTKDNRIKIHLIERTFYPYYNYKLVRQIFALFNQKKIRIELSTVEFRYL